MNRLNSFFYRFWLSLSDVNFYKRVWHLPLSSSLLFFLGWMTIFGIISSSYFAAVELPPLKNNIVETISQLPEWYPENLEINLDDGQLTTNQEVLTIPLPESWLTTEAINPESTPELLLVISSNNQSPDEWLADDGENTIFFANQSNLYINNFSQQNNFQWSQFTLNQLAPEANFQVTKQNIEAHSTQWTGFVGDLLPYAQIAVIVVLTATLIVSRFFVGLFETIFIFLLLKIYGKDVAFMPTLKFGLHLIVPAELINQIALYIWPNSPVSFLSLSFWILAIYILFTIRKSLPNKLDNPKPRPN